MADEGFEGRETEITVSWITLFKILAAVLLAYLSIQLWPLVELLFLALLIALTLSPIVRWTRRRGWPEWTGIAISFVLLLSFVILFFGFLVPSMALQASALIKNLPALKEDLLGRLPESAEREHIAHYLDSTVFSNPDPLLQRFVAWGKIAVESVFKFLVMLVVAIYFLVDGGRVYKWLLAFLPEEHRRKMAATVPEIDSVVFNYMAGQFVTSLLCSVYAFFALTLLHVPNSLLLAVLAGVFDILPIIGFFLSTIPAIALALTVSPLTALAVFLLYAAYHLVENYFIVPRVYGNKLRLSTLTVLVSCLAGSLVAGVVGAIAVLPLVASYPIIERIWLRPYLERDTVVKHAEIEEKEHGPKES